MQGGTRVDVAAQEPQETENIAPATELARATSATSLRETGKKESEKNTPSCVWPRYAAERKNE